MDLEAPMGESFETKLVGGLEHFLFSHRLGISSSQLTFIFFRGVAQPPTRICFHPHFDEFFSLGTVGDFELKAHLPQQATPEHREEHNGTNRVSVGWELKLPPKNG